MTGGYLPVSLVMITTTVLLHSTGFYQIGDEVSGDLEVEREGSVWTLKQVDHEPPPHCPAIESES